MGQQTIRVSDREYPPPLQGAQRPQRGRVGEGVSDIIDEPKFQFFN